MHIHADSWNNSQILLSMGREGGFFCFCFFTGIPPFLGVSKLKEIDAMARGQREERAQNWISLLNPINAMEYVFKFLVQAAPPILLQR